MSENHPKQRTEKQNNSIHLYLEWVAHEMINKGITVQNVVEQIKKAEIEPSKEILKEVIWRPMQKIMFKKDSTTFLTKGEVTKVYEAMSMWLAKNFEIDLPFPSDEDLARTKLAYGK